MINQHPSSEMLEHFVDGALPASLTAAVSIHTDMCPQCQLYVEQVTAEQAQQCFDHNQSNTDVQDSEFAAIFEAITFDDRLHEPVESPQLQVTLKHLTFELPRALSAMKIHKWRHLGKLSRAAIDLDEGRLHTHLLYIHPDSNLPRHSHKGFEMTLLLQGQFSDGINNYHVGDFIMLDSHHQHQPTTLSGCLCMTVVSDQLQFSQGWSKLLNPIGQYLY